MASYTSRNLPDYYVFAALWAGQKGSLLFWALVLATLVGACALLVFIFSARAVQFVTTPANAELRVAGGFAPHFRERWMLLPGQRRVAAWGDRL